MSDRETTLHEPGRNSTFGADASKPSSHDFQTFRGLTVLEQLPTRGAEADLYLLEDSSREKCVLKLYRHTLEPKSEVLERIREISRTRSDCLVVFHDAGFDETTGRWFELLEYMPLGSLKDVPVEIRREPEFIRKLISELAEAIHCLHREGIVHCDVKPGNVLVRSLDPLDLVLTDFGISSLLDLDASRRMTALKGTPMYRPPEAFSRMAGHPGDWWGLGMIVLELLTEEHPFAGLSEAQILHALTVGSVEVPEELSGEWRSLLRGLLAKDDARRWGYAEVVRWLTGRQETPEQREPVPPRPFRFEGRDFSDPGDLARALCENEEVWRRATKYANYFRPWLEYNGMTETAKKLGEFEGLDPDTALSRFVYACSGGPFVWLGRVLDVDGLCASLKRAVIAFPDEAVRRIAAMTESGELLILYDVWAGLSGDENSQLRRLLEMLKGKNPEELRFYAEALQNPENFLWPADVSVRTHRETMDALARMRVTPPTLSFIERQRTLFVVPHALLCLFERAESCAEGLALLNSFRDRELLIPRQSDGALDLSLENLKLSDYEAQARVTCWGHTPETLARLDYVEAGLEKLRKLEYPLCNERLPETLARLADLRKTKITADALRLPDSLHALLKRNGRLFLYWLGAFFLFTLAAGFLVRIFAMEELESSPAIIMYFGTCYIAGAFRRTWREGSNGFLAMLQKKASPPAAQLEDLIPFRIWGFLLGLPGLPMLLFPAELLLSGAWPGFIFARSGYKRTKVSTLYEILSVCAEINPATPPRASGIARDVFES